MPQPSDAEAPRLLAPILFAALAVGAILVLLVTREVRDRPPVVYLGQVERSLVPGRETALIKFRAGHDEAEAAVLITTVGGTTVRSLGPLALDDHGVYRVRWDGLGPLGEAVPPGRYRVSVRLEELDREIGLPGEIRVTSARAQLDGQA